MSTQTTNMQKMRFFVVVMRGHENVIQQVAKDFGMVVYLNKMQPSSLCALGPMVLLC
jgi:hypothetical protein